MAKLYRPSWRLGQGTRWRAISGVVCVIVKHDHGRVMWARAEDILGPAYVLSKGRFIATFPQEVTT